MIGVAVVAVVAVPGAVVPASTGGRPVAAVGATAAGPELQAVTI